MSGTYSSSRIAYNFLAGFSLETTRALVLLGAEVPKDLKSTYLIQLLALGVVLGEVVTSLVEDVIELTSFSRSGLCRGCEAARLRG